MKTVRRKKRTKSEVEQEICKVALSLIEQKGFSNITLTEIVKSANIEPSVFYNRYNTLDEYLDLLVRNYDYWFSNIFQDYKGNLYSENGYEYIFNELLISFSENKIMQKLLSWELSDNNETTNRTAKLREFHTIPLAENFHDLFKETQVDIRAISSLIVGGIYYLVLHRDLSTFSGIDMNSQDGKERIANSINYLSKKLFSELKPDIEKINIARKMKEKNIGISIIAECVDLPIDIIDNL